MKIFNSIIILVTTILSLKHGWDGLHMGSNPEQTKTMADMGLGKEVIIIMSIINIVLGIAILFPKTFFIANLLHAFAIVMIIALFLRIGNYKTAFIEIPFLLIPLVLIYLGHPLKK